MRRRLFVTTALPYANGPFHIGHIMEYIQADVWVRFQRMQGCKVHFMGADDAHGAPIMLRAEADGVTPEELVRKVGESHQRDYQRFHLSFDNWYTTQTPRQPEVKNKIAEWLGGSGDAKLADWDISRDAPYFGFEIPDAPGKYFYVWLDAPIGYLASLKNYFDTGKAQTNGETRSFEEFIAPSSEVEQYHFIGKDIIYHHTLFWPAMLEFAQRKLPTNVYVHGFITVSGEKMSKSRGTGISPQRYLDVGMNPEWLRDYIAAKLNDKVYNIDFNPDDLVPRVKSDLMGEYV